MKKTVDINKTTLAKEKSRFIKVSNKAYYFIQIIRGFFLALLILTGIMFIVNAIGLIFRLFEYQDNPQALFALFIGGILFLSQFIPLGFAAKIFDKFRKGQTPFQYDVADKIKGAAISMLVLSAITQILCLIYYALISNNVFTAELENISINGNIDFTVFLFGILIYAFSYVFSYGAKLQQESDETL